MPEGLSLLAALVEESAGARLGRPGLSALRAALRRLAPGITARDAARDPDPRRRAALVEALAREVLIHETFFLRHPEELARIDWRGLLADAREAGRPELRVWSAGCSTGEEAYSLVIGAAEALGVPEPPVRVVGTDLSADALARARTGAYGPRAVRHLSVEQRGRWFEPGGADLCVGAWLRTAVTFAEQNLVRDPAPGVPPPGFDVVLCRNVLIYFAPATAARVVAALEGALRPGGSLVIGAADRLALRGAPPPAGARPAALADLAARRAVQATAVASRATTLRPAAARAADAPAAGPATPASGCGALAAPASSAAGEHATGETPAEAAVTALESGLEALGRRDLPAAVAAFRRARYLDADLVEAGLHLGRAHEAAGDVRGARSAYQGVLHQITGGRPEILRGRAATTDVAAACEARLHALPET